MKKALFFLLALFTLVGVGNVYAYDEGSSVNIKEQSGGSAADPVRVYQLVRYPSNRDVGATGSPAQALSAGDVVVWDIISDDGVSVNDPVSMGLSASTDAVAGVVVGAIPTSDNSTGGSAVTEIGKRNWGYIQIYGPATAKVNVTNTVSAGSGLVVSTTGGRWATGSLSTGFTGHYGKGVFGFAYDTESANTTSAEVFVNNG